MRSTWQAAWPFPGQDDIAGRTVDLPEGGAGAEVVTPLPPGARGTLTIDGLGAPLALTVRHVADGAMGLAISLDEAGLGAVRRFLDRPARRTA